VYTGGRQASNMRQNQASNVRQKVSKSHSQRGSACWVNGNTLRDTRVKADNATIAVIPEHTTRQKIATTCSIRTRQRLRLPSIHLSPFQPGLLGGRGPARTRRFQDGWSGLTTSVRRKEQTPK
jgi:hypothetical protein